MSKVKIWGSTSATVGLWFYGSGSLNCAREKPWINVTFFKKNKQKNPVCLHNALKFAFTYHRNRHFYVWVSVKWKTNVLPASTWALGKKLQPPALSEPSESIRQNREIIKRWKLWACALFSPVCSHVTLVNYSRKEPVPRGPRCSEQIMHRAKRCQSAGELMPAQIKRELTQSDSSNLTRADLFG